MIYDETNNIDLNDFMTKTIPSYQMDECNFAGNDCARHWKGGIAK